MDPILNAYILTLGGVVLAQASPGPNLMAVASTGLAQGRSRALCVVLGVASGMFIWAAGAALGLGAFFTAYPVSLVILKLLGGGYLLWLGLKALRAFWKNEAVSISASKRQLSHGGAVRRGLAVILTNPKAALMWSAVATYLYGAGLSPVQVLAFGPLAAVTALLIYGTYGLLFSSQVAVSGYARFARWFEAAFGLAFAALGGRLLLDGVRAIRN
ncbi:MAG: LysE family transporter [Pseudomonadota bacterium]